MGDLDEVCPMCSTHELVKFVKWHRVYKRCVGCGYKVVVGWVK